MKVPIAIPIIFGKKKKKKRVGYLILMPSPNIHEVLLIRFQNRDVNIMTWKYCDSILRPYPIHKSRSLLTYERKAIIISGLSSNRGSYRSSWLSRKHGIMRWAASLRPVEWCSRGSLRTSRQWGNFAKNMVTNLPETPRHKPVSNEYSCHTQSTCLWRLKLSLWTVYYVPLVVKINFVNCLQLLA